VLSEGLAAENLVKHFGDVAAVDGVSFSVSPGEVVGLLGPNGAGKTTILRMAAGILTPTSGSIRVGGMDLRTHLLECRQRIGFLSGDTQLYQRLSSREVLAYFGRLYGMEDGALQRRIGQLVEELEMGSFAGRPCGTLSSGQKQRANIARAFLHDPDVLILDEPTTALDVITGNFIVQSIRKRCAEGRAVLFSTHIMGEAEYLCDRIILLHKGLVMDQGTLAELLTRSGCANLTDTFLRQAAAEGGVQ
jgi:sodium transport system ATP-binding protein